MDEPAEKMDKIRSLTDAIAVAEKHFNENKTHRNAAILQRLRVQRRALQSTIPFRLIRGGKT